MANLGNATPWGLEEPNRVEYLATPTKVGNTFNGLGLVKYFNVVLF